MQYTLMDTFSRCLFCHILSWSYDGVCSDTECNNSTSIGREGRSLSVCCVADVLVVGTHFIHNDDSIGLCEGGIHETVNCTIPEVACKQDNGLGTVYMCTSVNQACMYSYKQYHFHTVTMPCIYF